MIFSGLRGSYASGFYAVVLCILATTVSVQGLVQGSTYAEKIEYITSFIVHGTHFIAAIILFIGLQKERYQLIIPHVASTISVTIFNMYIVLHLVMQLEMTKKSVFKDTSFKPYSSVSIFMSTLIIIINVFCLLIVVYHAWNLRRQSNLPKCLHNEDDIEDTEKLNEDENQNAEL